MALGHDLRPFGRRLSGLVEVGEFADLVHTHLLRFSADLALSRQEPMNQLFATRVRSDRNAIPEGRGLLPLERNATERGDQRCLALASVNDGLHT